MKVPDGSVAKIWDAYWREAGTYMEYPSAAWDLMDEDKTNYLLRYVGGRRGLLLEVGSGTARMSVRLAKHGFQTICLDSSPSVFLLARQSYLKDGMTMSGLAGDGFNLPFADNTFDGVLSTGLLEHFEDPQPLMNEMVRVAKKGGFVYADILPRKKWRLLLFFDFIRPLLGLYTDDLKEMPFGGGDISKIPKKAGLRQSIVLSAGILWPRWPVLRNQRTLVKLENIFCRLTHPLFKAFDGSEWADIFGVYYFVFGRK